MGALGPPWRLMTPKAVKPEEKDLKIGDLCICAITRLVILDFIFVVVKKTHTHSEAQLGDDFVNLVVVML